MFHPHKQQAEIIQSGISAEWLTETVSKQNNFYTNLFQTEKLQAFRDIEALVQSAPLFMFIKGSMSQPKCKFTRKLLEHL